MKKRRSRQGPPAEAAPEEEAAVETDEFDQVGSPGLDEALAAEREAHAATRERAETAEALVAETRRQAEDWVEESRGFMEQRIAEARAEVEAERQARLAAEDRLQAMMDMEADARTRREADHDDFEAARAEVGRELEAVREELGRERELRLEMEERLAAAESEREQEQERASEEAVPVPDSPSEPEPVPTLVASASGGEGCSVCRRSDEGHGPERLVSEGWAVEGDERVCPGCREAGWQLAPGVDAPFRRYSDRRAKGQSPGEAPDRTAASQTSDR